LIDAEKQYKDYEKNPKLRINLAHNKKKQGKIIHSFFISSPKSCRWTSVKEKLHNRRLAKKSKPHTQQEVIVKPNHAIPQLKGKLMNT
jgi:hypothetical protein